ncbi:hypothetical protein [Thermococcus sp.]
MKAKWSQLREEIKYTAKEMGIIGLNAMANVVIIYAAVFLLSPGLESGLILGMLAVSSSLMTAIVVTSPISWAKTLGLLEMYLTTPLSPRKFLLLKAISSSAYGLLLITGGLAIGNLIKALTGAGVPPSLMFFTLVSCIPLLVAFTLLFTLLCALIEQKHLDSLKVIIFIISYLLPLYLARYFKTGLNLWSTLIIAIPTLLIVLAIYSVVVMHYREKLSEAILLVKT